MFPEHWRFGDMEKRCSWLYIELNWLWGNLFIFRLFRLHNFCESSSIFHYLLVVAKFNYVNYIKTYAQISFRKQDCLILLFQLMMAGQMIFWRILHSEIIPSEDEITLAKPTVADYVNLISKQFFDVSVWIMCLIWCVSRKLSWSASYFSKGN